jgi:hypothetical protein
MPPQLALVNASLDDADTLRNFRRELDGEVAVHDARGNEFPDPSAYDGLVVTGPWGRGGGRR